MHEHYDSAYRSHGNVKHSHNRFAHSPIAHNSHAHCARGEQDAGIGQREECMNNNNTRQALIDANAARNARLDEIDVFERGDSAIAETSLTGDVQKMALAEIRSMAAKARRDSNSAFAYAVRSAFAKNYGVEA
jgi:hypothetical protein